MWSGLSEVDLEAESNRSHFYRQQSEFSSVPSDCSSDLKVQNLIADQVEKGKVIICLCQRDRKIQDYLRFFPKRRTPRPFFWENFYLFFTKTFWVI